MSKTKTIIGTAMFALFITGYSYGQAPQNGERNQEPPSAEETITKMDKDDDGKLSKSEVKGPLKNDFDKVDANEDGYLTQAEIEKAPKPTGQGRPKN